jgi:hypothetical protein
VSLSQKFSSCKYFGAENGRGEYVEKHHGEIIDYERSQCESAFGRSEEDEMYTGAEATVSNVGKPAKLETGITIQVPAFIKEGENIRVDMAEGRYIGRAK